MAVYSISSPSGFRILRNERQYWWIIPPGSTDSKNRTNLVLNLLLGGILLRNSNAPRSNSGLRSNGPT
jgi:hypothetical protein